MTATDTPGGSASRGRGRPPIGPAIEVRLPLGTLCDLKDAAVFNGVPLAELARSILCQWVIDHPDGVV